MLRFPHVFLAGALLMAAPLHAQTPAPTVVAPRVIGTPGVRREAGTWLFNDSIFVAPGENRGVVGGPVFLPNLRRDKKIKLPLVMASKSGAPINFSTLPLPDLRSMSAPGYDFSKLQAQLQAQVNAARATGGSYVGWSLPATPENERLPGLSANDFAAFEKARTLNRDKTAATVKQLRAVLDAVAPEGALILHVNAESTTEAVADIDAAAPLCDAVVLTMRDLTREALWPLKMARRVAEEQPDYDLPIFIDLPNPSFKAAYFNNALLEFYMAGATGFVLDAAQTPAWASVISRNPGLFSGAVTLEDVAILPTPNARTLQLVERLRGLGRLPLIGRLPGDKGGSNARGESLFALLDDQTSLETLSGLDRAARNGGAIYLEGLPDLKNPALVARLADMTGTTIEILPAPKPELMTLSDAWVFGDARGRELSVSQRLKWTIKTSLAAQARKKQGEDTLEASSAATLTGDTNGLLVAPLGKGRIIWLAHPLTGGPADEAARRGYYAAIAGSLQAGLAQLSFATVEDEARNGGNTRFSLRASKVGTPIVALFNDAISDANVTLSARSDAPLALDLLTNRELVTKVVGYSSSAQVTIPAHGFVWLTFGLTRAALDKERLAPRSKARVIK